VERSAAVNDALRSSWTFERKPPIDLSAQINLFDQLMHHTDAALKALKLRGRICSLGVVGW
jgi:hypothetical protein